ncbi:response regulator [Paenibacillus qinlingensis]|uniref:Two-component system response regulator YesN n=1 Tax=Paenibacillus qinlingensis TaxID=1837343 RepID=A0ABU1NNE2_9BACL|nr:response regulator [Paenibacillus qinlingensis]MDR6548986.1 two-component system response regulator YesN [Paenibacillus qinlingensis]
MRNGRVLIVEDQMNFRRGLVKMMQSGDLGWQVVGEAGNGQDALTMLEEHEPDLVLTDIRMPIMDGIEFVGHLRKNYPDMIVIILTGYKNFEYAQAAVRLGALDILIKPCTEQDVRQIMNKASERFYEKYALQQKQRMQMQVQQDQEFRAVLLDLPYEMSTLASVDCVLAGKELWLLHLNNDDLTNKAANGKRDMSLLQFAFSNIVEELMKEAGLETRLLLVEQDTFLLVTEYQQLEESLQSSISKASFEYLIIHTSLISMGIAPAASELAERYLLTKEAVSDPIQVPALTTSEVGTGILLSQHQARVREMEVQLMSAILVGQEDSLHVLLNRVLAELGHTSPEEMRIGALSLSIAMHGTIQKQFDPAARQALARMPSEMPQNHWTSKEVLDWAAEQVKYFLLQFNHWQVSKSDNVVERAIKYIEEHYNEECRLTDVATHIHLNPSYFSVVFKKATGESFTRFVTRVRMDKAALLLRNTDMKIFEIACAIGFDEPNYFTNVFKQQFHMSPKEYRSGKLTT